MVTVWLYNSRAHGSANSLRLGDMSRRSCAIAVARKSADQYQSCRPQEQHEVPLSFWPFGHFLFSATCSSSHLSVPLRLPSCLNLHHLILRSSPQCLLMPMMLPEKVPFPLGCSSTSASLPCHLCPRLLIHFTDTLQSRHGSGSSYIPLVSMIRSVALQVDPRIS